MQSQLFPSLLLEFSHAISQNNQNMNFILIDFLPLKKIQLRESW